MRRRKEKCCTTPESGPTAAVIDTAATVVTNRSVTVTFKESKYPGYGGAYVDCVHTMSIKEARQLRTRLTASIVAAESEYTA